MENVRNRSKIKILNGRDERDEKRLLKLISKPNFRGALIFEDSQLVSVRMGESTVTLDKPIHHGVTVLDHAKVSMYDWHYGYMKPKYGNSVDLDYTDTNSFIYKVRTKDFYEDIREDVPTMFDTSAYPEDHPSGLPMMNKKVPGLMKGEAVGRIITKAICLRPKQYAYEIDEYDSMCEKELCNGGCKKKRRIGNGGKKCKGVKKGVVKNTITTEYYEDCLFNDEKYRVKFNILRSRKHDITTECVTKVTLSADDNKRIIPNDPEHKSLVIGHWRAKHPALCKVEINTDELFKKGSLMNLAYNAIK